jgi:hypothetical protein
MKRIAGAAMPVPVVAIVVCVPAMAVMWVSPLIGLERLQGRSAGDERSGHG